MTSASLAPGGAARIGPNAIICTLEALRERIGAPAADELLAWAQLDAYRAHTPSEMVPEADVRGLYRALRARLAAPEAEAVARAAGEKTARYILKHRIPPLAQAVLRPLPARFAAPLLLAAIRKHSWTFAGSARLTIRRGPPVRIVLVDCPICREAVGPALCGYYAAAFEGLFRELVALSSTVDEVVCRAAGTDGCVFEIAYEL